MGGGTRGGHLIGAKDDEFHALSFLLGHLFCLHRFGKLLQKCSEKGEGGGWDLGAEGEMGDGDVIEEDVEFFGSGCEICTDLGKSEVSRRERKGGGTAWETFSLSVMSCSALYWATIALTTSVPIDGSTRSSQSNPNV